MRYGLNAAIIAGIFCLALGEPALVAGDRFSDYLLGSREIAPLPGLYFEDDVYFHGVRAQRVEATQALNLSAGVSNCKVSRGRSFS
jgi:hypothetical protein